MFKKILIANRGEIACRVIRSAQSMGIKTVAVYSTADAGALHVQLADEAVLIGAPPTGQSYLRIDAIMRAIAQTGAEAVHPGYGFLSENQEFAKALAEAVVFIGPASAVAGMGDKIQSKKLAIAAGVKCDSGVNEPISSPDEAVKIAQSIGYPVMLKALAGGGGKGMRLAYNDRECREGLQGAMNEAKNSFGDDRVFIEKFIEQPRHLEIQILGDKHGNILYIHERECSLQRRHQKVIEEAPSPFISAKTRQRMGEQAVALARAVGYYSAGTVEFIVDKDQNFYFLEMNTRLQVEHPITECISNLDLVAWMIRIANGQALPFKQSELVIHGHAIEARVYAEDPRADFCPRLGGLTRYIPPKTYSHPLDKVPIDSGVEEGSEISMHYDPMIAKLVAHGRDRAHAIEIMRTALAVYVIEGVNHNIEFLHHLIDHEKFLSGATTTNLIGDEYPKGLSQELTVPKNSLQKHLFLLVAGLVYAQKHRLNPHESHELALFNEANNQCHYLNLSVREHRFKFTIDGAHYDIESHWQPHQPLIVWRINHQEHFARITFKRRYYQISMAGRRDFLLVLPAYHAPLQAMMKPPVTQLGKGQVLAPMPGVLVRLSCALGDHVKAGEELAVMEAMKMENILRAEQDGIVKSIKVRVGDTLRVDDVILEVAA